MTTGTAADGGSGSYASVLAWYFLIHVDPAELARELADVRRVLRPGGRLLLGFFASDDIAPFDHAITRAWTWSVDWVAARLHEAGFDVEQVRRRQDPGVREHGEAWAALPGVGRRWRSPAARARRQLREALEARLLAEAGEDLVASSRQALARTAV